MKTILLLVVLLFLTSFASASSVIVSVTDASGGSGATVGVPINLEDASNVGSMDIRMSYDTGVLHPIGVDNGELSKNAYLESNTASNGEVVIALADASGISGSGQIALVSFEVVGDTGSSSPLILEEVSVHDIERVEVITTTEDGTFSVTDEAKGAGYANASLLAIGSLFMALYVIRRRK